MKVAVIGATGVVGETILRVLEERNVPVDTLLAYASRERDECRHLQGRLAAGGGATSQRIIADRPHVAFFAVQRRRECRDGATPWPTPASS